MAKKRKKRETKFDKFFLLSWKKVFIGIIAWFVAFILHNAIYALFKGWYDARGGDEAFFFIIAIIVIPLYFLVCFFYTLIKILRGKK